MYLQKTLEIPNGWGGFTIMEFWGHVGGVMHSGISEGKGGLKHESRLWLGMDIFWNCPMYVNSETRKYFQGVWKVDDKITDKTVK